MLKLVGFFCVVLCQTQCTVVKVQGPDDAEVTVKRGFGIVMIAPPAGKGMAFESQGIGALVSNREFTLGWHHVRGVVDMGDNVSVVFPPKKGIPSRSSRP